MLILGLDIATTTGFAIYDTQDKISKIICGKINVKGESPEEKAAALSVQIARLFNDAEEKYDRLFDLVIFEEPLHYQPQGNNTTSGVLRGLSCAAAATCHLFDVKWKMVPIATWRKNFFGFSRKAGVNRAEWKRLAIVQCEVLGIKATNSDAAEAVGIALYGGKYGHFQKKS